MSNETNQRTGRHPIAVGAGILAAIGGLAFGVWLLFQYVVTDAALFLDYLKALVWPVVVVAVVFWLRAPVRDKLRELLRLEVPGASMEFQESRTRRLEAELVGPFALLGATGEEELAEDDRAQVEAARTDDGVDGDVEADAPPNAEEPADVGSETEPHTIKEETQTTAAQQVEPIADLLAIGRAVELPKSMLDRAIENFEVNPEDARAWLLSAVLTAARKAQALRHNQAHRPRQAETRDSIEAVIRKSAEWGYDMGRAGAPKTVPDVEWNSDGTWRITTEVPERKAPPSSSAPPAKHLTEMHRESRTIRELENEIKKLEREKHSTFSALGVLGSDSANKEWLREMKRRLRRVDPMNPWSIE